MTVSGFTIVRNGVSLGYPVAEAINSILPLCDEMVVNVGVSGDGTLDLVRSISSPKVVIIEQEWDMSLRVGGRLISQETNRALARCTGDWCFYIQADEVLHERFIPVVAEAMRRYRNDGAVEALQFRYRHFYGSFDYYQDNNRRWYTKECRVIRRRDDIVSWGDGMDFRHRDGSPLRFKRIDAEIYHYGWVRPPRRMVQKNIELSRMYGNEGMLDPGNPPETIYNDLGNLKRFAGSHPAVMRDRVAAYDWTFDARLEDQPPDWLRHVLNFLHPLTKRLRRWTGR